jgi:hypothetical protein
MTPSELLVANGYFGERNSRRPMTGHGRPETVARRRLPTANSRPVVRPTMTVSGRPGLSKLQGFRGFVIRLKGHG